MKNAQTPTIFRDFWHADCIGLLGGEGYDDILEDTS